MREGLRIYNLFPTLAGSIAEWTAQLPRIAAMGFNAVYINPFHYPGFSGSLYAVKDYYRLNPRFRGNARGSDDALLRGFTKAAQGPRAARHHGPRRQPHGEGQRAGGAPAAMVRPRRERRDPVAIRGRSGRSRTERPSGATSPNSTTGRRSATRSSRISRSWCAIMSGSGFAASAATPPTRCRPRCGAGWSMPPRRSIPDVVFCAENLGASEEEVLALAEAGFDYLFNSLKWWDFESPWLLDQYEKFRHIAPSIAFPESHDTERLVTELLAAGFPEDQIEARYRQAYALSAAFSTGVMMPMGFEYGWSRRISVVPNGDEDEPEPPRFDLQPFIAAVNRMKASVPALNEEGPQRRLSPPDDPLLVLLRQTGSGDRPRADPWSTRRSASRATWSCTGCCRRPG